MKIAIVGAGWYGCHFGLTLSRRGHEVTVFEREEDIFKGSSGGTQFRIHQGFHYPRSWTTRKQIIDSYDEFMGLYPSLAHPVGENLYAVASEGSLVDYGTYAQVMHASGCKFKEVLPSEYGLQDVEGACLSHEGALIVDDPRPFFKQELGSSLRLSTSVVSIRQVPASSPSSSECPVEVSFRSSSPSPSPASAEAGPQVSPIASSDSLSGGVSTDQFDWCLICTYGAFGLPAGIKAFFEPCLSLLLRKKFELDHVRSFTIMDGPFISLYPYWRTKEEAVGGTCQQYTLTHVKYTPFGQFATYDEAQKCALEFASKPENVRARAEHFLADARRFVARFDELYEFESFFTSIKCKPFDASASRHTIVQCEPAVPESKDPSGRVIHVISGKVNSIIEAERMVSDIIFGPESYQKSLRHSTSFEAPSAGTPKLTPIH